MSTRILHNPTDRVQNDGIDRQEALVSRALALVNLADDNDGITVRTAINFDYVIDADIDGVNDTISEEITGSIVGLTDIGWKPVDVTESGLIVLEVSASIETLLSEPEIVNALDDPASAPAPEDITASPETAQPGTAYVLVDSQGGVVQETVTVGEVVTLTVDWDEINETSEETALAYAENLLDYLDEFPARVRDEYRNLITEALEHRGFPLPETLRDHTSPANV